MHAHIDHGVDLSSCLQGRRQFFQDTHRIDLSFFARAWLEHSGTRFQVQVVGNSGMSRSKLDVPPLDCSAFSQATLREEMANTYGLYKVLNRGQIDGKWVLTRSFTYAARRCALRVFLYACGPRFVAPCRAARDWATTCVCVCVSLA